MRPEDYKNYFGNHDAYADTYEESIYKELNDHLRENYFEVLTRVMVLSEPVKGIKILDIGIGTGLLTEKYPLNTEMFGIDISAKMMKKVKEKKLNVKLASGDFRNIPYPSNYFDRIVSTYAFHHLTPDEKKEAFTEMKRVLKDKGKIIIGDLMFENAKQKEEIINRFIKEERKDIIDTIEEEYFTIIDDLKKFIEKLGYSVEYERMSLLSWVLTAENKNK